MALEDKTTINLEPAKVLSINPNGKYLIIFPDTNYPTSELTQLNEALKNIFGAAKVLAIFAKDVNNIKITELLEE